MVWLCKLATILPFLQCLKIYSFTLAQTTSVTEISIYIFIFISWFMWKQVEVGQFVELGRNELVFYTFQYILLATVLWAQYTMHISVVFWANYRFYCNLNDGYQSYLFVLVYNLSCWNLSPKISLCILLEQVLGDKQPWSLSVSMVL